MPRLNENENLCGYCEKLFRSEELLNKHLNEKHKNELEEDTIINDDNDAPEILDSEHEELKAEEKAKEKQKKLDEILEKVEERDFLRMFNGEKGLSEILVENKKDVYKLNNLKTQEGYYFNQLTALWEKKHIDFFVSDSMNFLESYVIDELKKYLDIPEKDRDSKTLKSINLILNKCRTDKFIRSVFKIAKPYLVDIEFVKDMNLSDHTKYLLNFKNGVYDLQTGKLRNRLKSDKFTCALPYDYREDTKKIIELKKEILEILLKISNDNQADLDLNLSWLGYCSTGETKEQKFLLMVGEKASNGKSTLFEIFEKCFSIYTLKLDNHTFDINFAKRHKMMAMLQESPKRMGYVEEMSKKQLDVSFLKDIVSGKNITNEIMYGTMVEGGIKLNIKLCLASNKSLVFDTDNGVKRRGLLQECKTVFMEEKDYKKLPLERRKGKYIKNKDLPYKFDNDDYKMAFASIIIEYAKKYIKEGLKIPDNIEDNFNSLCDENDVMKSFIEENYEITENDKDRVYKEDFLTSYNLKFKTKLKWAQILCDVKRIVTYDPKAKKGANKQGCIIGIKERECINEEYFGDMCNKI